MPRNQSALVILWKYKVYNQTLNNAIRIHIREQNNKNLYTLQEYYINTIEETPQLDHCKFAFG